MTDCVFCDVERIETPVRFIRGRATGVRCMVFEPLNPATPGHELVVPVEHAEDATKDWTLAAGAMEVAAWLAWRHDAANIITNIGEAATQSVFHLHLHVVPRAHGDRLPLPWSRPPVCPICGPGYRLGQEGCRHG